MSPTSRLRLGWILPGILFLTGAADLLCRLVPPEAVAFRAWEAMISRPSATGPFRASSRFETSSAYGDFASVANLPMFRHYRSERFTTDASGYRNSSEIRSAELLLVGDSFGAGCGVSDEEMFSVALEKELGRRLYNASGLPPTLDEIRANLRRLGMSRGLVLYEHLERWGVPLRFTRSWSPLSRSTLRRWSAWIDYSPLQIWCRQAHRRIEDDRLLPNASAHWVLRGTLPTGDTMLFLRSERDAKRTREDADRAAAIWRGLADELKKEGLDLVVVLVPNKSTIYGPLTREGFDPSTGRAFLERIQDRLRTLGVPAIDLTPDLEKEARSGIGAGRLLYRLDDAHWTPEGHQVAVGAIAAALRTLR